MKNCLKVLEFSGFGCFLAHDFVAWFLCGFSVLSYLSMPGLGWHLRECGLHSEEAHAHFIPVQRNPGVEWIHVAHVSPHVYSCKPREINGNHP